MVRLVVDQLPRRHLHLVDQHLPRQRREERAPEEGSRHHLRLLGVAMSLDPHSVCYEVVVNMEPTAPLNQQTIQTKMGLSME